MSNAIERTMTSVDVKAGRRFYHKDDYRSQEYAFRKQFGRHLTLMRGSNRNVGQITGIFEDAFQLTIWLMNQEVSVLIPYTECLIIEPRN